MVVAPTVRPLRIVAIDDDENVRELLLLMFALDDRFDLVATAATGRDGIELVSRILPDAVVVDLDLPDLDGFAVVDHVRSLDLDTRIVVFSAFPDPFTLYEVLRRGAHAYLNKATAWAELLPMIAGLFHDVSARSH